MGNGLSSVRRVRRATTFGLYAALLVVLAGAVVFVGSPARADSHELLLLALLGIVLCSYASDELLRNRAAATLDAGIVVATLGLVLAGPIVAAVLLALPDFIRVARRGRSVWNLGLLANVVSYLGAALAGATVLALMVGQHPGAVSFQGVLGVGAAMVSANYFLARLLFATLLEGEPPGTLLAREFFPLLPLELAMLMLAALCGLLIAPLGVFALVLFAAIVYLPQLGIEVLLRAPSVGRLPVDAAAGVYRDALIDDLRLSRHQARAVRCAHALLEHGNARHALEGSRLREALVLALETEICERWRPTQPRYRAPVGAQIVLVARAWARLTAKQTPALSHREALAELHSRWLAADAPTALAAAVRIAEREQALTHRSTAVPRLHWLPLPHSLRSVPVAAAVGRLAANQD